MVKVIPSAVPRPLCARVISEAKDLDFLPGNVTAGSHGRSKKHSQIAARTPRSDQLFTEVVESFLHHRDVSGFAFPKDVSIPQLCRYDKGDYYDLHIDRPFNRGLRADISFTLVLSPQDEYEGGELRLGLDLDSHHEVGFKPPPGTLVMYDTGLSHRVMPVTRGTRLVMVGWMESGFQNLAIRTTLRALHRALDEANTTGEIDRNELKSALSSGICNLSREFGSTPPR